MKTAVFSSYVPLTETILRLFPLDFLASHGVPVAYWDLSPLFGHALPGKELPRPFVRRFTDWEDLETALLASEAGATCLVTSVAYEPRFFRLYRLMSRSPAKLGIVIVGTLPMPKASRIRDLRRNIHSLLDAGKLPHILLKRSQCLFRRLGGIRNFDVAFTAGTAARREAKATRIVPINQIDYDDFLAAPQANNRLVMGRYAVYLDQFAPFHPDFAFLGIRKLIDPIHYYALLNAFFKRLEAAHGIEVVIAAHPKASYPRNPFGGRKIFQASTLPLVRHCEFALATISTSISFAVLNQTPLIFFTTDEMIELYRPLRHDVAPFHFARVLGRRCINLDRPSEDDLRIDPVDTRLYDDYKYRYLVSRESEGRLSREAYLDFFTREFAAPVRHPD